MFEKPNTFGEAEMNRMRLWGSLCWVLVLAVPLFAPQPSFSATNGTIIHVAPYGTDEPSCGTSQYPCRTLHYAVERMASGGIIKVAQGIYTAPEGTSAVLDLTFGPGQQGKNVTIIGGYSPPNWDDPSSDPTLTVLDGENLHRVVNIVSVPEIYVRIQGVTIRNGLVSAPSHPYGEFSGGGLYCLNDHPYDTSAFVTLELVNVVFRNNRVMGSGSVPASGGGASLYRRCRASLENVVFEENEVKGGDAVDGTRGAHVLGGGLFATASSDVTAKGLIIRRNAARAGSGGRGYGAHEWDRADASGGGAAFQQNSVELQNVVVEENLAEAGDGSEYGGFGSGGGLFFEFSSAVVISVTIQGNEVYGGDSSTGRGGEASGGGMMATDSRLILSKLVVAGNRAMGGNGQYAGHAGGALYFTKAAAGNLMEVSGENLIIADNRAEAGSGQNRWGGGGGIFAQDADVSINHATIVSNSVLSTMVAPAVIALHNFAESRVHIANSIIAFHPTSAFPRAAVVAQREGDEVILENVVFWQNGGGNIAAWFEGAIVTVTNQTEGDPRLSADFHLQKGSVAIDRAVSSLYTDIDGEPRPFRAGPDIGADEYVPIYLSVTSLNRALLLRWKTNLKLTGNVSSYRVHVCEADGDPCNTRDVGASISSYTISGLINYHHYVLRVDALDANGELIESSNTVEAFPTDRFVYLPLIVRRGR